MVQISILSARVYYFDRVSIQFIHTFYEWKLTLIWLTAFDRMQIDFQQYAK